MAEKSLLVLAKAALDELLAKMKSTGSIEEWLIYRMQADGIGQWICGCEEASPHERIDLACRILNEPVPYAVSSRRELPVSAGIYFVLTETEVLYIGTAKNIRVRVGTRFQSAKYIAFVEIDDDTRIRVESLLVAMIGPKLNRSINIREAL